MLILDKKLAKKSKHILFLKIENDGFDLGAQRREIDKNDLPLALQNLEAYKSELGLDGFEDDRMFDRIIEKVKSYNPEIKEIQIQTMATLVAKEIVLGNKDIVLSPDRYKEAAIIDTDYPVVKLKDLITIQSGYAFDSKLFNKDKGFPLIRIRCIKTNSTKTKYDGEFKDEFIVRNGDLIIGMDGEFNCVIWNGNEALLNQRVCRIIEYKNCYRDYIFRMIIKPLQEIEDDTIAVTVKHISVKQIYEIEIPLPPLAIQQQIVAEIEGYQKIKDGAKQIVNHYKPSISIKPDWEMVELGEVCKPEYGFTETAKEKGSARFIRITDIGADGKLKDTEPKYVELTKEAKQSLVSKEDILVARTGATYGKTMIFEEDYPAVFASFLIRLNFDKSKVYPKYYWAFAQSEDYIQQAARLMTGGGQPQFNGNVIVKIQIPIPTINKQKEIVQSIEEEMELVNGNKKLIALFEQKIKNKINEVWGVKEEVEIN